MRRILTTAGDSLHEMGHIVVLLALFIYIFALVGMKLYSGKFWFGEEGVAAPWDEVGDWSCRRNRVNFNLSHGASIFGIAEPEPFCSLAGERATPFRERMLDQAPLGTPSLHYYPASLLQQLFSRLLTTGAPSYQIFCGIG